MPARHENHRQIAIYVARRDYELWDAAVAAAAEDRSSVSRIIPELLARWLRDRSTNRQGDE